MKKIIKILFFILLIGILLISSYFIYMNLKEDKKQEDIYKETHFRPRDTNRLKMRGCKKIFHANENQKKAGKATFISDKIDFKIKNV